MRTLFPHDGLRRLSKNLFRDFSVVHEHNSGKNCYPNTQVVSLLSECSVPVGKCSRIKDINVPLGGALRANTIGSV